MVFELLQSCYCCIVAVCGTYGMLFPGVDFFVYQDMHFFEKTLISLRLCFTQGQICAACRGMYVLLFLQFASSTFYDPARRALEPMLVPKKQLHLATTLDTFAWSVTVALGSSLGGAVVSKLGTTMCFLLDSCTFVCAATCVLILQVKPRQQMQYCSICLLCALQKAHTPSASIQARCLQHFGWQGKSGTCIISC